MKKFIDSLINAWKIEELKNRILLTLGMLLVYRFGAQVTLPGIDATKLGNLTNQTDQGIGWLINVFTGGAFSQASVFALGIMPYISASIVVQLMGIAIPYLQKLQKDGESGRKKINQITRWLTILITLIQGPGYIYNLYTTLPADAFLLGFASFSFLFSSVLILVTGTIFAMWLGEKITDKGIGNGISLLIMVGIIARMPQAFIQEISSRTIQANGGIMMIVLEIVLWFVIIIACILLVMAVRKIPVQYARRTVSGDFEQDMMGSRQFIPLKLNASGVMPIIFAQAIMFIPAAVSGLSKSDTAQSVAGMFSNPFGLVYNIVFALLIIIFTYFYTAITVPTNKMADDLKRSGGFIPGIRPGVETGDYLDRIMSLITFPGSLFLALIAVFPAVVVSLLKVQGAWGYFYGGTSLLIMVGVAIDTIQQINSYLLNKHYDGLMKTGKNRKAVA
ncbi:MAG: preprotein translocase subunit SecY [Flavobacterium sp.]|uniref:preprotein translocase subunit SecY n=1 Tax=Flavobacterium sp. TaxID=239 RepID=UPI000C5E4E9B|nr:preprotein translocase subunit SecY [Flavobacterium sp.]MBF01995.1 preprotein translocase subunit SecY [Flavobacterium sp.]MBF02104.1 preprotein translocase subunit SecY [Flavobacterium sp.]|tara:strand:- start:364 stop:1707 length:1344 start_codon:yes stop_codon:yes gene_type:complete